MTVHEARMALVGLKLAMRQHSKRYEGNTTTFGIRSMELKSKFFTSVSLEQIEQAYSVYDLLPVEVQRAQDA